MLVSHKLQNHPLQEIWSRAVVLRLKPSGCDLKNGPKVWVSRFGVLSTEKEGSNGDVLPAWPHTQF